jgi:RHS repeat-associated protein
MYVRTPSGVRAFRVSVSENLWGRPGFTYTERVGYQHKVYELRVPWAALGLEPGAADGVELAFATYGTCSPCTCPPGEEFDLLGACCPLVEMDAGMVCCDYGVTAGVCNPPPPTVGAVFDLKVLDYTQAGFGYVSDVNDAPISGQTAAVGWSRFLGGHDSTAWNVGNRLGQQKRFLLPTWDDFDGGVESQATAINDRGEIVGWRWEVRTFGSAPRAFALLATTSGLAWSQDTDPAHRVVTSLDTHSPNLYVMSELYGVPGSASWANDLNNNTPPIIVGGAYNDSGVRPELYAFIQAGATATRLPHLDGVTRELRSEALAVNDAGVVAGYSVATMGERRVCTADDGRRYVCVGGGPRHPVLWEAGRVDDLGSICPTCEARAVDINDNDWVVGWASNRRGDQFNFIYIPSDPPTGFRVGMNFLGVGPAYPSPMRAIGGDFYGRAQHIGVNNLNQVVGGVRDARGQYHAFLYLPAPAYNLPEGFFYLEDLIPRIAGGGPDAGSSTHFLYHAVDITDSGHIIAYAVRRVPIPLLASEYFVDLSPTDNSPEPGIRFFADPVGELPEDIDDSSEDGDPINTLAGELIVREDPDLRVGRLRFSRSYASGLDGRSGADVHPLGPGWRHEHMWSLDRTGSELVRVETPTGSVIDFILVDGTWEARDPRRGAAQLHEVGSDLLLHLPGTERLMTFDASGRLTRVDATDGYAQTLTYSGDDLTEIADDHGQRLLLVYTSGRLTSLSDGVRTVTYDYDGGETLRFVTDASGHRSEYVYDADDRVVSERLPRLNAPFGEVYTDGRVTSQVDANGEATSFEYDTGADGNDTTITDPLGNVRLHDYDDAGRLVGRRDALGNLSAYAYDSVHGMYESTDALGRITHIFRNPDAGLVGQIDDVRGGETRLEYAAYASGPFTLYDLSRTTFADGTSGSQTVDRSGALTVATITDAGGFEASAARNEMGQYVSTTNALGGTMSYGYDSAGRRASITWPTGEIATTVYAASSAGLVTTVHFPDGSELVLTHDASEHVLSRELRPAGSAPSRSLSYTYDANGNPATFTDRDGSVTSFGYDAMDRLASVTDPEGGERTVERDVRGLLTRYVHASSDAYGFEHDAAGRLVTTTDAAGQRWTRGYDAIGRITSTATPLGEEITHVYDDAARTETVTGPMGESEVYSFDVMDHTVGVRDALGREICFTYDARGYLASATLPSATLTTPCADRVGLSPAEAPAGQYEWNGAGLLAARVDPNEQRWERRYDTRGRLEATEDPLGRVTSRTYDSSDLLATVGYPDGGSQRLSYDGYGGLTERRFTTPSATDEVLTYERDARGRVTSANGVTISYDRNDAVTGSNGVAVTRDPGGRMLTVTLAPGRSYTYAYAAGRLASVTDWAGGSVAFGYDDAGRVVETRRSNGVDTVHAYDPVGRLVDLVDGEIASIHIDRREDGRIRGIDRGAPVLQAPTAEDTGLRAVDAASHLVGHDHDLRGRVTSDGARAFEWTQSNRLAGYSLAGDTTGLVHDALGALTQHTTASGTATHRWSYAHARPCPAEREVGGVSTYFVCSPEGTVLYSIDDAGERRFYHFDERGNTQLLTDDAGTVVAAYAYLPYGEIVGRLGAASMGNPFTFSGMFAVIDLGDGLYQMRQRVYDSSTQRFLSRDPEEELLHPLLIQPYGYAFDNPMSYVDIVGAKPAPFEGPQTGDWSVSGTDALGLGLDLAQQQGPGITGALDAGAARGTAVANQIGWGVEVAGASSSYDDFLRRALSCEDQAADRRDLMTAQVNRLLCEGMDPDQANGLRLDIVAQYDAELVNCNSRIWLDSAQQVLESARNLVIGLAPPPLQYVFKSLSNGLQYVGTSRHNPFVYRYD